eukprot:TRINITY_DN21364_c0_g1_i2.p2 TRINITY_DN21364_c0_g1~~TRINITY_DN21364_c0_g1_i2.p2  ORF type:complete len:284 (+),score=91.68 TRINITY_DN21364_c0_g1_i2:355-1206(+)
MAKHAAALVREEVKRTQTQLSCLTLHVHELERERSHVQANPAGSAAHQEARQHRDSEYARLLRLRQHNAGYAPLVRDLNDQTTRLEELICGQVRDSDEFVSVLRERCIRLGQMLHRRMVTESEWAELRLVTREQEDTIARLRAEVRSLGGALPAAKQHARMRLESEQGKAAESVRVTCQVAVPPGALRALVTMQGHGLQALRATHGVEIQLSLAPGWNNVVAVTGAEGDVKAARERILSLCNMQQQGRGLVTYPRSPSSRVTPIPSPWAKQCRQRAEVDARRR